MVSAAVIQVRHLKTSAKMLNSFNFLSEIGCSIKSSRMRSLKVLLSGLLTISIIYLFNNQIPLETSVPPMGKFLDPFHGFWQNCYENPIDHRLELPGLSGPVSVVYDSTAVAHIYASSEQDLYLVQGYVTAHDRLWQMEFQTHAAAGRISEILGAGKDSVFLNFDRDTRRMGMVVAAKNFNSAVEQDSEMLQLANQYTSGINSYIDGLSYAELPVEYKLLDYKPEHWTNLKIGLLLKNMARTLNTGEKDIEMTNALSRYGLDTVNLLFPDRERVADPIIENTGRWPKSILNNTVAVNLPDGIIKTVIPEKSEKDIGSNNWAVSGSKTKTGYPILCNDPHLALNLPSVWYMIHLQAPGYNAMGASLPGSPGIISGFNDSIAWGETNAQRDVVDWYRIRFKDDQMSSYLHDGEWKSTKKSVETFVVRNKGIMTDTIVFTHHGPIRYDQHFRSGNERARFAYRWISHDVSNEMRAFYLMNKAHNLADYHEALDHFSAPAQNFVFASVHGDIAMRIQGKFPARGLNEGRFVQDGSNSSADWKNFIPDNHNIQYNNPERGFVSSANQYPADSTYPYYITSGSYEAYRNRRINDRLRAMNQITVQDMMDLQLDNHSLKGEEALPEMLKNLNQAKLNPAAMQALEILKKWNRSYNLNEQGATYFESWWTEFYNLTWDEFLDQSPAMPVPTSFQTVALMKEDQGLKFFDIRSSPAVEQLSDVLTESLNKAADKVEEWKQTNGKEPGWAAFKNTSVDHLMRLPALSRNIAAPGNREAVNATGRKSGPSWRMVVSLEPDGVKAWGIYPGGQSGNAGSKFYDNMLRPWSEGQYYSLSFVNEASLKSLYSIKITPSK
jgi:penicillin amidase